VPRDGREEAMTEAYVDDINAMPGWVKDMGIVIPAATPDEVSCEREVGAKHHQPYGIVHGGVPCGVIETLAFIGAALVAMPRGQRVVGLENHTSFIRAVRTGKLHAAARPVTQGRKTQVWEGWIRYDEGEIVAQGPICSRTSEAMPRPLQPRQADRGSRELPALP
jgi:uncharacterized protein (TIGR00369 family)